MADAKAKDVKNQASTQNIQQQQPIAPKAKPSENDVIKVTLGTSRPTVTTNGTFSITGYLKNVSTKSVAIYSRETALVVQPEVTAAKECVFGIDAFFPTERPDPTRDKDPNYRGARVVIRPNEGYQVTWDVSGGNTKSCDPTSSKPPVSCWDWLKLPDLLTPTWWKNTANFVPGNYVFIVSGKAYDVKTDADDNENSQNQDGDNTQDKNKKQNSEKSKNLLSKSENPANDPKTEATKQGEKDQGAQASETNSLCNCESGYHTYSESVTLNVAAPQIEVVFFSALGGLLAYLMLIFKGDTQELADLTSLTEESVKQNNIF